MSSAKRVHFFVSYTSADRPWAEWIAWVLEEAGYSVRIQAWDFGAGANFVLEMDEAARISTRTVAVLSPAFLESRFGRSEWAAAFREDPEGKRRRLLPVRVRECDVDGLLGSVVYVDLVGLAEDGARERLLSEASGRRAKPSAAPAFPGNEADSTNAPVLPAWGAAIWNVPAVQGRWIGREALLDHLAQRLSATAVPALTRVQVLHGLGGVGKTRVAVEFARRHRDDYDVVWWVRSEDPVTILSDYAALADALALPEHGEREQEARVAAVRMWLETHRRWLLVFDNAPGPAALANLVPDHGSGQVLITSRHHGGWRGIADPYLVDVWPRNESVSFLEQRTGDRDPVVKRHSF
jgi:TIR domain/NB-ARC domain